MGIREVAKDIWHRVAGPKPKRKIPGVDYAASGVLQLNLSAMPLAPREPERVDRASLGAMGCHPTIAIVKGDLAKIVDMNESPFDSEKFLAEHNTLDVDTLADGLTIGALRQLAARPRVDLVETTFSYPVSFVGDFHGNKARFEAVLRLVEPGLRAKELASAEGLHSLGDLGHAEDARNVFRVYQSLKLTKAFMLLNLLFPDRVRNDLGNHDIFCPVADQNRFNSVMRFIEQKPVGTVYELAAFLLDEGFLDVTKEPKSMMATKKNVPQSYLMLHYLCLTLKEQGFDPGGAWEVIKLLQGFYDTSPMALRATSPDGQVDMFAAHSCPVGVTTIEQLRAIRAAGNEQIFDSTLFSRPEGLAEIGMPEFNQATTDSLGAVLGMSENGLFLFGHTKPGSGWTDDPFPGTKIIHCNASGFGRFRVFEGDNGWQGEAETLPMENNPALIFSH